MLSISLSTIIVLAIVAAIVYYLPFPQVVKTIAWVLVGIFILVFLMRLLFPGIAI